MIRLSAGKTEVYFIMFMSAIEALKSAASKEPVSIPMLEMLPMLTNDDTKKDDIEEDNEEEDKKKIDNAFQLIEEARKRE